MLTRRTFCGGLGALGLGGLAGCRLKDVKKLMDRPLARLGVMAHTEVAWKTSTSYLEKAFRFYRQEGVDAVVIAGGATKDGYKNQFEVLAALWVKVFGPTTTTRLILEEGRQEVEGFPFVVSFAPPVGKSDVLTFHGGAKQALTDDLRFYDPAYRAVYAGSMGGTIVPAGYVCNGRLSDGKMSLGCIQGLLVSVYPDTLSLRRLDFTQVPPKDADVEKNEIYAEDVAPELTIDRHAPTRREASKAPEFWADTVLQVLPGYLGASRIYTVRWPNVQRRFTGARAFCYEVSAHLLKAGETKPSPPFRRQNVLSNCYWLSERCDAEQVTCVFPQESFQVAADLGASVVVSVVPVGSFGDRGKPVYSAPFRP